MRRWTFRILKYLLLGLVTTFAATLVCIAINKPKRCVTIYDLEWETSFYAVADYFHSPVLELDKELVFIGGWNSRIGSKDYVFLVTKLSKDQLMEHFKEHYSDSKLMKLVPPKSINFPQFSYGGKFINGEHGNIEINWSDHDSVEVYDVSRGWPMQVTTGRIVRWLDRGVPMSRNMGDIVINGISLSDRIKRYPGSGLPVILPLRLLYAGLFFNVLFYALFWYLLVFISVSSKNLILKHYGRCPVCRYNLKHDLDSGCPECGWNRINVKNV